MVGCARVSIVAPRRAPSSGKYPCQAVDHESGVAAPIRDATGAVVGDLVSSCPDNRTSPEREKQHGEIVRAGAAAVSRGHGFVDSTGRPLPWSPRPLDYACQVSSKASSWASVALPDSSRKHLMC
jgi:hypothetical protein